MQLLLTATSSILLADFLSGLAHWLEDSYFTPDTFLLGRTIQKNVLHHRQPQAFVVYPWHTTIRSSAVAAGFVATGLYAAGLLGPVWVGALVIAVFANQVHKWSHLRAGESPRVVAWLQSARVLQSPAHHLRHHSGCKNTHYCVVTNVLNPVLDRLHVWRGLERVISVLTAVGRRVDDSLVTYNYGVHPTACAVGSQPTATGAFGARRG